MARTVHDLLDEIRSTSSNNRDLGTRFEHLMLTYLKSDPQWAEQFSDVWMLTDAPIAEENKRDLGIDLVARDIETGGFCAIQCKFYEPQHAVAKADIDSFFAASGKGGYTRRLIISTTEKWGPNAEEMLAGQQIPVSRIGLSDLEASPIDWDKVAVEGVWTQGIALGPDYHRDKKQLRRHQEQALTNVFEGFQASERGKLIMACGTGKTFTSLKIAEHDAAERAKPGEDPSGITLFLVPSIALLSQTLREWTAEASLPLHAFAVCSDVKASKQRVSNDSGDQAVHDLALPATTDPAKLIAQLKRVKNQPGLTVVFSTYHSIDVIAKAQQLGLGEFDLVLCDEAHRTTGVTLAGEEESSFVRVHDNGYLRARRRLYMTATPRIYREHTKDEAKNADAVLCSMDDETLYGPEFHKLGFGEAVERELLTDYKVMILAVDESQASAALQRQFADENMELALDDAAKIIGCWNGMAKRAGSFADGTGFEPGERPMRRAVAFARTIAESQKIAATFANVVNLYREEAEGELACELDHVDGGMNTLTRNRKIDWLKADPGEGNARILTNARCLSEGVDVPDLDAVLFLHPRNSHVDVVQSVGRVMRKAPGKKYGYIILPVAIPAGIAPDKALADNKRYKVVWEVLNALRAHDDRMNAHVNQIDLNKNKPKNIMVGTAPPGDESLGGDTGAVGEGKDGTEQKAAAWVQDALQFEHLRDAIYARIVKNVGQRTYWEDWATDIARIAAHHVVRIQTAIELPDKRKAFDAFVAELRSNLNPGVREDDAIDMLAQHIITKPVFDALFADYAFASHNPVSKAMEAMLAALEDQSLEAETAKLEEFYKRVRVRAEGIDNHEGRQTIIKDLYEKFFKTALPRTSDRLGIVYTPIEVVDFIIRAVDQALGKYFNASLSDEGVHIIDPFTGTGTFITRLLQSGLIKPEDLLRKYTSELHANEIVLLAYYIAAVNIEAVFHDMAGGDYKPFEGIVLTDTFQLYEGEAEQLFGVLEGNSERAERQKATDIRVVIGNPPYSVGQDSQNDDNQNLKYEHLDARIQATYAAKSTATNKNSLYDSYIRAFRWASDRIKDKGGIVCYVSNGGYIDGNTADGLRKSFTSEFDAIYCYNLRGNQRTAGELSRKEGGKIFGSGSRNTVAIILLVKGGNTVGEACQLHYRDIGDYLTREQKLTIVAGGDLETVDWQELTPSAEGDWINQRDDRFNAFRPIAEKERNPKTRPIFDMHSGGLKTGRDSWVYSFSREQLSSNVQSMIEFYNDQVESYRVHVADSELVGNAPTEATEFIDYDPHRFSWNRADKERIPRGQKYVFDEERIFVGAYRPFMKQRVYFDARLNDMIYRQSRLFPYQNAENLGFYLNGIHAASEFAVLAVNNVPCLDLFGKGGQFVPRYTYREINSTGTLFEGESKPGFERVDNISEEALRDYQRVYGDMNITRDDIFYYVYGLLHSPEYRDSFEADLRKSLPRIPKVAGFRGLAEAGRQLVELHLGYESVEPYGLVDEEIKGSSTAGLAELYRVDKKMKFRSKDDQSAIIYNTRVTLTGIPEEAYRYQLGSRSAIEWIMDRYYVKTDKASGIVNDPNEWSDDPRYIVDLLKRIVTVSLETMKIVDALPPLDILPEQ